MTKVVHIINLADFPEGHELFHAQKITLETMRTAIDEAGDEVEIVPVAAVIEKDKHLVPAWMQTHVLNRTIEDELGIAHTRNLPLLQDLIDALGEQRDADVHIYSNVDISLMPHFYRVVTSLVKDGLHSFVIHRRRIESRFMHEPIHVQQSQPGKDHTGFDCFVWDANTTPKLDVGKVCLGIPHVGNTFAHNLICHAESFHTVSDLHLTYHIGMEVSKVWGEKKLVDHNHREFRRILKQLYPSFNIAKVPGAGEFLFKRHFKWLMNPNFHYPTMWRLDMKQFWRPRPKPDKQNRSLRDKYHDWLIKKIKFD